MVLFDGFLSALLALVLLALVEPPAKATDIAVPVMKDHLGHHGHVRHFGLPQHATGGQKGVSHETRKQFKKDVARDPDVGKPSEFMK